MECWSIGELGFERINPSFHYSNLYDLGATFFNGLNFLNDLSGLNSFKSP